VYISPLLLKCFLITQDIRIEKKSLTYMDEAFLKISSDIFFVLLNLEIDLISQLQRQNEEKKINAED